MDTLLSKYAADRPIHFLTMDIEGAELPALQSNDWDRFRPEKIAVEIQPRGRRLEDIITSDPVSLFLQSKQYRPFSVAILTYFFYDTTKH